MDDATQRTFSDDVPREHVIVRVLHMAISAPTDIHRRLVARRSVEPTNADAPTSASSRATLEFESFYRAHYASVVRLAYSLCGSMPVAEELAQEAFVSAHTRWRRVIGFDRPDLWVRRVVINRSISYRRREAIERKAVARLRPDRDESVEPVLCDEVVWQAMRELSPRQAEVLALFYVEDQPMSAVAEILGLGPETVKTHLKRGRAALAALAPLRERRAALAAKLDAMGHVR